MYRQILTDRVTTPPPCYDNCAQSAADCCTCTHMTECDKHDCETCLFGKDCMSRYLENVDLDYMFYI